MEPVELKTRGLRVFVDYAHTPDALGHALTTLRELWADEDPVDEGRLICVFGCGGDRDREKRRPMGGVVAELADVAIVTSDNPRSEDPEKIIDQILEGMRDGRAEVVVEPDRRAAIRRALRIAERGDAVLIAGKGHEAWQRLRGREIPFDDRQVVLEEQP
jgi:UDP-N-acetylmuramoyl-L-alanyl-D-glutamate--2,6-diaminopimelate ligase